MLKAPFSWPGGKSNLRSKIIPYLPEHRQYIEPYFGAGGVFFAKVPAKIETINDLDSGVMGFFCALRDAPEELERIAALTPYSRELYDECNAGWRTEKDPVCRAWMWWVVANQGRSGQFGGGWGYVVASTYLGPDCPTYDDGPNLPRALGQVLRNIARFRAVAERLLYTQIECRPALNVLRTHCRPDSLAYLDPPYAPGTRTGGKCYEHEMTEADHAALVEALLTLPGRFILSGYPTALYAPLEEAGWGRVDFATTCLLAGCKDGQDSIPEHARRTESLWLDPQTTAEKLPAKQLTLEAAG